MNTFALAGDSIRSVLMKLCCKTPDRIEKDEGEWMQPIKPKKSSSCNVNGGHCGTVRSGVVTEQSGHVVSWIDVLENLDQLNIADLEEGGGENDEELCAITNVTDYSAHRRGVAGKDDRDFYSKSLGHQRIGSMRSGDSVLKEVKLSLHQDAESSIVSLLSDSYQDIAVSENGEHDNRENDGTKSSHKDRSQRLVISRAICHVENILS
mmetsp:Transcript_21216/g.32192  ORF Transcript_21216/g.32192 Transcript_21216/m.32192 type:complete len:208 (+) Transcript_21216:28-651(+)|eukprot:CAMPEP_0196137356 /NCGR_PEP_ID=MMETSP0910-20130528/5365_1 /TAXON_ID=49265 /ORGANISM="Thalassiosira rotula, Strain GSO102" /LENGTH=207 /DNA_ID=CAMNT_0041397801 /DNA_START=104 /DNA_END=727 /DNA_ORIENTATION=+